MRTGKLPKKHANERKMSADIMARQTGGDIGSSIDICRYLWLLLLDLKGKMASCIQGKIWSNYYLFRL